MSSDPKFCAEVAEKVLGLKRYDVTHGLCLPMSFSCASSVWINNTNEYSETSIFCPDIDANADYRVLCHVREKWEWEQILNYATALDEAWGRLDSRHTMASGRMLLACDYKRTSLMQYAVGDYSRAALAALKGTP